GWEVVCERGPLTEERMLELAGEFDAFICGDDLISRAVIEKSLPKLKVISKYGIGVDKIDVAFATEKGIPVLFTPGVNHTTVAEHTFALILAVAKNIPEAVARTRGGEWFRPTGIELWKKNIGIVGLGRIGVEVARRANGFQMGVHGFGNYWPEAEAKEFSIERHDDIGSLAEAVDILSLHTKLTENSHHMINSEVLGRMKKGSVLINCGRGELVDQDAVIAALDSGRLAGYAADVLDIEPAPAGHPLVNHPKAIITPHIGSRTFESVPRQAVKATRNLINCISGEGDFEQVN
ncbi:MAG: D-3-phosphoglycerate dehydrogenase, partial [Verrucomicrobiales bacterium]